MEIKADSPAAIKALKSVGVRKSVMLTGDADAVGRIEVGQQIHVQPPQGQAAHMVCSFSFNKITSRNAAE